MCPSLESLAKSLRLSENIAVSNCNPFHHQNHELVGGQGVTFLALGNGAPDIFASIAGIRQSRPELVIGQLFGGGIFVTTVVVGAIILTGNFKVMERPICRDIYFYASSCFIVWSIAYIGTIFLWESITVLVVYVVYIGVVIVGRIIYTRQTQTPQNAVPSVIITGCSEMQSCTQASSQTSRRESLHSVSKILKVARKRQFSISSFNSTNPLSISDDDHRQTLKSGRLYEFFSPIMPFKWEELKHESVLAIVLAIVKAPIQTALILTIPTIDPEDPEESWSRKLNCLHLVTGPLMIMVAAGGAGVSYGGIPCPAIVALTGLVLGLVVFFTSKPDSPPIYYPAFSLLAFFVSCCWTYSFASEVVALLETLGFLMNVSEAILGLTVLAWGNSLGDLIANVAMARHGYQRMAISACFGGPLLSKSTDFVTLISTTFYFLASDLLLGIGIPYSIVLPETENFSIKVHYYFILTVINGFPIFPFPDPVHQHVYAPAHRHND